MGQRRIHNEWPAPRNTRHVWVLGEDRLTPPVQGYVVAWNRHAYKWSELVVMAVNPGLLHLTSIYAAPHLAAA